MIRDLALVGISFTLGAIIAGLRGKTRTVRAMLAGIDIGRDQMRRALCARLEERAQDMCTVCQESPAVTMVPTIGLACISCAHSLTHLHLYLQSPFFQDQKTDE